MSNEDNAADSPAANNQPAPSADDPTRAAIDSIIAGSGLGHGRFAAAVQRARTTGDISTVIRMAGNLAKVEGGELAGFVVPTTLTAMNWPKKHPIEVGPEVPVAQLQHPHHTPSDPTKQEQEVTPT